MAAVPGWDDPDMSRYASRTTVPVERSRNEIEHTLRRYGASQFMYGWTAGGAVIAFIVNVESGQHRQVRFQVPLPSRDDPQFTHHSRGRRTPEAAERGGSRRVGRRGVRWHWWLRRS